MPFFANRSAGAGPTPVPIQEQAPDHRQSPPSASLGGRTQAQPPGLPARHASPPSEAVAPAVWPSRRLGVTQWPISPSRLGRAPLSPRPGDKYRNFAELAAVERAGIDYSIRTLKRPSDVAIVAPHGGLIERGTSEITWALAGSTCSAYSFDGTKARRNGDLHITSTRFDEPQCLALLADSATVLTVHGERSPGEVVFAGGADTTRCDLLDRALTAHGFIVRRHEDPGLQGTHASNICNKGRSGKGIQLELSLGLRQALVDGTNPSEPPRLTERFTAFRAAVRQALGQPFT